MLTCSTWLVLLATTPAPLTLEEVLEAASRTAPALTAAEADVDSAQADSTAAAGAFDPALKARAYVAPGPTTLNSYPQLRLDALVELPTTLWGTGFFAGYRLGRGIGGGRIADYYGERATALGGELRAGVAVPLLRDGPIDRRRAALARAELGQIIAAHGVEQQRLELRRTSALRYFDWAAAGQRRAVARALLKVAADRDSQLAARVKTGDVALFDQQDNQRALVQRQAFVVQTERSLQQSAFELSLFYRDPRGDPVVVGEERLAPLPEPDLTVGLEANIAEAQERRPDLSRLRRQLEQQRVELKLAENQVLPGLDVGLVASRDLGEIDPNGPKPGVAELEVSALLDVPLLLRTPLGKLRAARAAVRRSEALLKLASDRVAMEVRDAQSALVAAKERLRLTRQEIDVAVSLEQGERTRFGLGDSSLLFVNIREQATAEARLREIDALLDYHKAAATFIAAMGRW